MMRSTHRTLLIYQAKNGSLPFNDWLNSLRNKTAQAAVDLRITRLTLGLFGDCKSVGNGVYELRIHTGPGYRVYYGLDGNTIVVILSGGDKSSQTHDIQLAKAYFEDYRSSDDA